jgi:transcriptional pleiotropic regulator of transition state genes
MASDHANGSVGSVRSIDENGRIVVPAELRKRAGLDAGALVDFRFVDGSIVMTKVRAACVLCGGTEQLTQRHGKDVCSPCLQEIRDGHDPVDRQIP